MNVLFTVEAKRRAARFIESLDHKEKVTSNAPVKAAAQTLKADKGQCLVYDNRLITP